MTIVAGRHLETFDPGHRARRDIDPGQVLGLVTAPLHLEILLDEAQEPVNIEANVDIIWRAIASSE
ncbi:hypothetical protein [Rhodococcus sp. IEGM 1406]|uniref:hypothetical protein n=1 Tax=Rhodococcus sp. IEGM 1406 TaxID=3047083 RepID=UPI0024B6D13D|nr:hypothetical protein [Rhodococcus sp. IEGM 1406]MDI9907999.1 hypothetical protein [Rhodococcus sp. IEGM 1406]